MKKVHIKYAIIKDIVWSGRKWTIAEFSNISRIGTCSRCEVVTKRPCKRSEETAIQRHCYALPARQFILADEKATH